MTREQMLEHVAHWIAAWNRRDVNAVLCPFAEEARFVSPKAAEIAGTTVLEGRQVIGDYWRQALDRIGTLRFRLGHVTCDVERQEAVVFYEATLGGVTVRARELMRFNAEGRQVAPWWCGSERIRPQRPQGVTSRTRKRRPPLQPS